MLTALVMIVGTYFVLCYAWGIYLILRLATGRRVRRLLPLRSTGTVEAETSPESSADAVATPQTSEPAQLTEPTREELAPAAQHHRRPREQRRRAAA